MKIHGKEIRFLRTVKTSADIAKLCPEGNIERISELFQSGLGDALVNGAKVIHYLNEGYEMNRSYEEPGYEPNIISVDEIMYLNDDVYTELFQDAMNSITNGTETTVEIEEPKKKEKGTQE